MSEPRQRALEAGDCVVYTSNTGATSLAEIRQVHYEDSPPFYTIHIADTGVEKQTDEKNLTYLPLCDEDEEAEEAEEGQGGSPSAQASSGCVSFLSVGLLGVAVIGLVVLSLAKKRRLA